MSDDSESNFSLFPCPEGRIVVHPRQDFLLRYLATACINPCRHVLMLCNGTLDEFMVYRELQRITPFCEMRPGYLGSGVYSDPFRLTLRIMHLLRSCNLLIAAVQSLDALLENYDFCWDIFQLVVLWDSSILDTSNQIYTKFITKHITNRNPPLKVLSMISQAETLRELTSAFSAIERLTPCKSPIIGLSDAEELHSFIHCSVPLSSSQKCLYDALRDRMYEYQTQVDNLGSKISMESVNPWCAVGTQEYSEWVDSMQLQLYLHNQNCSTPELDKISVLLYRLKQYNTALKILEETSPKDALQLLAIAHREDRPGRVLHNTITSNPDMLSRQSFLFTQGELSPTKDEFLNKTAEDFEAHYAELSAYDLTQEDTLSPKAFNLISHIMDVYELSVKKDSSLRILVICYCQHSMDFITASLKMCNLGHVQAFDMVDMPDFCFGSLYHVSDTKLSKEQIWSSVMNNFQNQRRAIYITTRFTSTSLPILLTMDWTEVLHYDADAFSVAANRLAEGWAPSATHYFYYSGDNDGHRFHNNSQAKLKDLLMSTSLQVEWIPVPLNLCRRSISSDDIHSMQKFNPEDAQHDNIIKENEVTNVFNTYSPNIDYFSYSYKEEPEAKIIDSSTLSLLAGGNDPMLYSPPYRRTDGPPTPPPPPFPIDNRFAVPSQNKPIQPRVQQQQQQQQPQPTAPRGPPYKAPSPLLPPSPEPAYTAKQPQHNTTINPNNPNLNPWSKERTQIRNNNQDLWSSNFNSGFVPKQQQQQQQPHNTWNTPYPKKGISHKVDRAHQQLAQAGELDKHKQRVAPPLPWPMAEMVISKLWSEEDAKQIWNSNYQRLWPKASPVYYFGSALHHETGVVMFTAETEVYCRVPRFEGDTVGSPMYLLGKGEATTKKEAQRKAAIDILNLLAQYKILHVAPHFQEPRGNNNEE